MDQLRQWIVPRTVDPLSGKSTANQLAASAGQALKPLFVIHAHFNINSIELSPSLEDIQEAAHAAGTMMLAVTKGILIRHVTRVTLRVPKGFATR